jgi:hypothetical protein
MSSLTAENPFFVSSSSLFVLFPKIHPNIRILTPHHYLNLSQNIEEMTISLTDTNTCPTNVKISPTDKFKHPK